MRFFDRPLFDFNGDGKTDMFETFVGMQMMAQSSQEAIDLTGEKAFYVGVDEIEELEEAGLDYDELEMMDEEERREALEEAGLDPDEFEDAW